MSTKKKALLVGSSFSAAPIFFALKRQGLHVSVCGKLENDPCHQYADASFFIDYSDAAALKKIVESDNFDFLVPACNDYSYMSCTSVADKYAFPGYDTLDVAQILHTKSAFREFTSSRSLPVPDYKIYNAEESKKYIVIFSLMSFVQFTHTR
jgi:phosphoribosylaminoimidazole carboxylase (NCAIR synthetase)